MVENSRKVGDYNSSEAGVMRKGKRNLRPKKGLLGSGHKEHNSSSEAKKKRNKKDANAKGHIVVEDHHSKKSQKMSTTNVQALESEKGQGLAASATSFLRFVVCVWGTMEIYSDLMLYPRLYSHFPLL